MTTEVKPQQKPYRILVLGDYRANTGFGIVMASLMPRLAKILEKEWEINICAINYWGEAYWETPNMYVFSGPNLSADAGVGRGRNPNASPDEFGRSGFLRVLYQSNADVGDNTPSSQMGYDGIFIIQDAHVACGMVPNLRNIQSEFKKANKKNFKSILYFPIDSGLIDRHVQNIEFFDKLITYNEYSRNEVLKCKPGLKGKINIMPHGIDNKHFYPIPKESIQDFRAKYFGENKDKFIVLNLNRNQPRKDIPCTIFGFQEFLKKNPDSFLYLHMNPKDAKGWNLHFVLEQTDLVEGRDYMFPPAEIQNHGADTQMLNKIYNACDVYLTTSLGEGWGLGVTEAMACNLPVIAPAHTSFNEIGDHGNRLYALENLYPVCSSTDSIIREQCDYIEVAEKLSFVDRERSLNTDSYWDKIYSASKYMETLDWDDLANRWARIIEQSL